MRIMDWLVPYVHQESGIWVEGEEEYSFLENWASCEFESISLIKKRLIRNCLQYLLKTGIVYVRQFDDDSRYIGDVNGVSYCRRFEENAFPVTALDLNRPGIVYDLIIEDKDVQLVCPDGWN